MNKKIKNHLLFYPKIYNEKTDFCIAVPITSKIKNYPFEVKLPANLKTKDVVLADQIISLDFVKREAKFIEKPPNNTLKEIKKSFIAYKLMLRIYLK